MNLKADSETAAAQHVGIIRRVLVCYAEGMGNQERVFESLSPKWRKRARWCPEYALFATDEQREAARRALLEGRWHPRVKWVRLAWWPPYGPIFVFGWMLVAALAPGALAPLIVFVGVTLLLASAVWLVRRESRRWLRRRLVSLGMPVCIPCGYDLRGQTEARCPECGAAFDVRLLNRRVDETGRR